MCVYIYIYLYIYVYTHTHRGRGCQKANEVQSLCFNGLRILMGSWDLKKWVSEEWLPVLVIIYDRDGRRKREIKVKITVIAV